MYQFFFGDTLLLFIYVLYMYYLLILALFSVHLDGTVDALTKGEATQEANGTT